ncbi:MAG: hypothetical protein J1E34_03430 [Oscillospiraceae bacterium]|nr:hypothetical protein [Oscillospiraceae bacterium]
MKYPFLNGLTRSKGLINTFYGYEDLQKVRTGAFSSMLNLSSDKFPLLSVRSPRKKYFLGHKGTGSRIYELNLNPDSPLTAAGAVNNTVTFCSESDIYYKGVKVAGAPLLSSYKTRKIIPFGKNFFVVPDGRYIITDGDGVSEVKHAAFQHVLIGARFDYVDEKRTGVSFRLMSPTEPEDAGEGYLWLDVSEERFILKKRTDGSWTEVCEVFVMLSHEGANAYAAVGDKLNLTVSGVPYNGVKVAKKGTGYLLLNARPIYEVITDHIVIVKKVMPVLDFALEHGNRIWGCRFGENENGEFVNEIYSSALGDPTLWDKYDGISTDSYTVSLGCPGEFTGAAVTGGDLIFFKENYIIRVSGYTPQDFTVSVTPGRGVKKGHGDSCVVLNEKIFYLSSAGVTVYDGALPYVISEEFSTHLFSDTLAVSFNGKYYLAAKKDGIRRIYVYDTETGLWHIEDDDFNVRFFIPLDGTVFMMCRINPGGNVYNFILLEPDCADEPRNLFGEDDGELVFRFDDVDPVLWYAETGELGADSGTGIIRSLIFRVELQDGARFKAELRCGNSKKYIKLCEIKKAKNGAFSVPVNTPRCSSFSIRLSGEGDFTLYSIGVIREKTGEVNGFDI